MRKTVILVLGIAAIAGLSWFVYDLMANKGSSVETELIDFAVKDAESVDRVIISNDFGQSFEIVKQPDGTWTDKNGNCIVQESAEFIIDAFKNIEFKGYLAENSVDNYTKMMISKHTKVDIYQNGEWTKTWFIGPATPDHYGQIMLLDSKEYGKSDKPVIMHIKGVYGIIEPRFFADPLKWQCTHIFSLGINDIKKVDVKFIQEPTRSFSVERNGTNFKVLQQEHPIPNIDTSLVFSYLQRFKKIHYEIPNYVFNTRQVDSLKSTTPFCVMTVNESNGKSNTLKMYRIPTDYSNFNELGQEVNYDTERFWCVLPNGKLVKCQYFVFNPLILGHIYFPMDLSALKLKEYTPEPSSFSHDTK